MYVKVLYMKITGTSIPKQNSKSLGFKLLSSLPNLGKVNVPKECYLNSSIMAHNPILQLIFYRLGPNESLKQL